MSSVKGKLIVLEGLDGSGKSVQFALLNEYLREVNFSFMPVDFPDYQGSFFGRLVGRYLDGEFGDVYEVNPYVSSLLYAGDRLESQPKLAGWLAEGRWILANRYVGSNMAYHSSKLAPEERPAFIEWLKRLEFEANRLPQPDLVIYLNASVETSHRMVGQKDARVYTGSSHDIHERNQHFLQVVSEQYLWLCEHEANWQRLDVCDETGNLRPREEIHAQILTLLAAKGLLTVA
ncbi:MAG: Thymidylate kinase [Chloroflexi bacterium]|jgi:dTMP kinase|nr:Thymidylate kinase [Chloroflexota bacterium]